MPEYTVKPLDSSTWPDFASLVERHNGVWGGCWCIGFHQRGTGSYDGNRSIKETMVREGKTHASLVYDGDLAIGWCQFGPAASLPRIKHRKKIESEPMDAPDWRITCFFVDKQYRSKGVSAIALAGALHFIAEMGGGVVESYPENVEGRKTAGAFLYNSSLSTFERQGFERIRQIGKHHWLVRKTVHAKLAT
ncbi:MAG: GNAT family N-acetyltransferase [Armatimonadetes bacterium]|nr:GNAT family N-acetyltransferase [Armatimonadota bacterium]